MVSSLDEMARVVDESADVNTSQLVGTHDGEVVVPTYDWAGYLGGVFRNSRVLTNTTFLDFQPTHPESCF